MPLPTSVEDPYFSPDGGFAQYGTFEKPHILGGYIVKALQNRQAEKITLFQQSIDALVNAFKHNPQAKNAFLDILEDMRAEGLIEMVLRRASFEQYHIPEHPAEFAYDIQMQLTKEFNQEYPEANPTQLIANEIFIGIAKAAAAWHDVIQTLKAPANELESIKVFVAEFTNKLNVYKLNYKLAADAITAFQEQLEFIATELILHGTWLIFGMKDKNLSAKPLDIYIDQAIIDTSHDELDMHAISPAFKRLSLARLAMSQGDTKRFSLDHVIEARVLVTAFNSQPENDKEALEHFFNHVGIVEDVDKEEFLGLMCQNLRIFTELNRPNNVNAPPMNVAKIGMSEHKEFIKALNAHRNAGILENINYGKLFYLFVETKKRNKSNLTHELEFANALGDGLWKRHAAHLDAFIRYAADTQLKAPAKEAIMKILFLLATKHQHGSILLSKDELFHHKLEELANQVEKESKSKASKANQENKGAHFFNENSKLNLSDRARKNVIVAAKRFFVHKAATPREAKP